jgi:DNA polymerase-3 subunit gamma/tau
MARGTVKVGFPESESHAKDSLNRDNQRTFLEGIASELLGTPVKIELIIDPNLRPPPVTEFHFDLDDHASAKQAPAPVAEKPVAKPAPEPAPAPSKPAPAEPAAPATDAAASAEEVSAEFQNDPLIKSAVEKFKLKLAARS